MLDSENMPQFSESGIKSYLNDFMLDPGNMPQFSVT
jgi:hypothetical protein